MSESTGRVAAALAYLRAERGITYGELVMTVEADGVNISLRGAKAFCQGERGCYALKLDKLVERMGCTYARLYQLATVAVPIEGGWVVECCVRCSALLPASGRHAAGWRFSTCFDGVGRWMCPCPADDGRSAIL